MRLIFSLLFLTMATMVWIGAYDQGIMELGATGVCLKPPKLLYEGKTAGSETYHLEINIDRGVSWKEASTFVSQALEECKILDERNLSNMQERGNDFFLFSLPCRHMYVLVHTN